MSASVVLNASRENVARSFNGYLMLLLMLFSIGWFVWAMGPIIANDPNADFIAINFAKVPATDAHRFGFGSIFSQKLVFTVNAKIVALGFAV